MNIDKRRIHEKWLYHHIHYDLYYKIMNKHKGTIFDNNNILNNKLVLNSSR